MYINVGKAFTMPNLSDTFKTVNRQYQSVSGRNLKPEEGWNYELGIKHITNKDSWKVAHSIWTLKISSLGNRIAMVK